MEGLYVRLVSSKKRGQKLIDVAGGTGDIALDFIKRAKSDVNATILDLSESMMVEGQKNIENSTKAQK